MAFPVNVSIVYAWATFIPKDVVLILFYLYIRLHIMTVTKDIDFLILQL